MPITFYNFWNGFPKESHLCMDMTSALLTIFLQKDISLIFFKEETCHQTNKVKPGSGFTDVKASNKTIGNHQPYPLTKGEDIL